jgi:hypothetical protein
MVGESLHDDSRGGAVTVFVVTSPILLEYF